VSTKPAATTGARLTWGTVPAPRDWGRKLWRRGPRRNLGTIRQIAVSGLCVWLAFLVGHAWSFALHDLRTVDRDKGKRLALEWITHNVPPTSRIVTTDSLWVDLVRANYPSKRVIWYTKLDVDKDVRIPDSPQWAGIDYVVLDQQDDLSVHVQDDGLPSKDTIALFPTLGGALKHSRLVASFGGGLDRITIRMVDPSIGLHRSTGKPTRATK
jgi:hypothetical protein